MKSFSSLNSSDVKKPKFTSKHIGDWNANEFFSYIIAKLRVPHKEKFFSDKNHLWKLKRFLMNRFDNKGKIKLFIDWIFHVTINHEKIQYSIYNKKLQNEFMNLRTSLQSMVLDKALQLRVNPNESILYLIFLSPDYEICFVKIEEEFDKQSGAYLGMKDADKIKFVQASKGFSFLFEADYSGSWSIR